MFYCLIKTSVYNMCVCVWVMTMNIIAILIGRAISFRDI